MNDKYKNKYRIASARLSTWDYRWNAAYFVTICTKNRAMFFGKITNGKMYLLETGTIAEQYWSDIPAHFPHVRLGAHVVMPNHVHGIVVINDHGTLPDETLSNVETLSFDKNEFMASISPKSGSLSTIIRSYKSAVSKQAHLTNSCFAWQERFHDHIIRDEESYQRIQDYISNNVAKWKDDKFYTV